MVRCRAVVTHHWGWAVQKVYPAMMACRGCGQETRSKRGLCRLCLGREAPPVPLNQPSLDELTAFYQMRMRAMRDLGMDPAKTPAGDADAELEREGVPDLPAFLALLRKTNEGMHVVQRAGGEGSGGSVQRLPGPADAADQPIDPCEHAAGCESGGEGKGGGPSHGRQEAFIELNETRSEAVLDGGSQTIRVTRFWRGVTAGTEAIRLRSIVLSNLELLEVRVEDGTLFGRTVRVPAKFTERLL